MMALECCIKTDGFAVMNADELFFINGGSGANAGVSHTSVGDVSVTTVGNHGTITFISTGHASNQGNNNATIIGNYGNVTVVSCGTSGGSSGGK